MPNLTDVCEAAKLSAPLVAMDHAGHDQDLLTDGLTRYESPFRFLRPG